MNLTAQAAPAPLLACATFRRATSALAGATFIGATLIGAALVLVTTAGPATAAEPGIKIELNKVDDKDGACLASFVVQNDLGHTLDRFNMDLYVFDRDGVIARRVGIDLAPLRKDKTTVALFSLIKSPCGEVSRILVNDIPSCRSQGTGESLDCLAGLSVSSRGLIEMVK